MPTHRTLGLVLVITLVLLCPRSAQAQTGDCYALLPGCLDNSFGVNGKVTAPAGMEIGALAIQNITTDNGAEQRIIAVGTASITETSRRKTTTTRVWMIARYLLNGTPDTAFGNGGVVQTRFPYGSGWAHAVALQPDNKLVVAGEGYLLKSFASSPYGVPVVARYHVNGALDTSFGTGGMVGVPYLKHGGSANGIALQSSDGKIVATTCYPWTCRMGVFRLNVNGTLDKSFNGTGIYVHVAVPSSGQAVAIQNVGGKERIVVAGRMVNADGHDTAAVWRLTSGGALDTDFGGSGWVMTDFSGYASYYNAMAVDSANRVIAAGNADGWPVGVDESRLAIARYLETGAFDLNFGINGEVFPAPWLNADVASTIGIQPDGRILLSGSSRIGTSPAFWWYAASWRVDASGWPDGSFGVNGWVTTDLNPASRGFSALVQQSDGKFVAAGGGALARYYK